MADILDFFQALGPWGMLACAFIAATLLPVQSEAVLVGMIAAGGHPVEVLVLAASVGNVAGAVVNWAIGRYLGKYRSHPRFPVKEATLAKAERYYQRIGPWALLLSWAPIIGDPITMIAGFMREGIGRFLLLVFVGKTARYVVVAAGALAVGV